MRDRSRERTIPPPRQRNRPPNYWRFVGGMSAMKFGRVITDPVQMNRRRFIIRCSRYIPFAGEFRAHVSLDLVQGFFRWRFVEAQRDAVLVDVQPHLLHVRMRFDQPDHARPRAGARLCPFNVCTAFLCQ